MKCPRCHAKVGPEQHCCTECGFSATFLHHHLGNQWVRLERLTDAAHCLRLEDERRVEVVLDNFERRFPQAFFATYLGVLPNTLNVLELGFWLLNQGAFNTHSIHRRNDFGVVLVIDPGTRSVGISLGYAVEAYFTEVAMSHLLRLVASHVEKGAFGTAIETACQRCSDILRKRAKSTRWEPDSSAGLSGGPGLGLHPLRNSHPSPATQPAGRPKL